MRDHGNEMHLSRLDNGLGQQLLIMIGVDDLPKQQLDSAA